MTAAEAASRRATQLGYPASTDEQRPDTVLISAEVLNQLLDRAISNTRGWQVGSGNTQFNSF